MTTATRTTTKWNIDKAHSEIQFKAKHLMITTVTGVFNSFDATVETEGDDFTTAQINFTADINSIDTRSEQRDVHLKSDDFFNAEKYPTLSFVSTNIGKAGDNSYIMEGDFTIRGVTKRIRLNVEFEGIAKDPWGNTKSGFSINGTCNRTDFGLKWNVITEAGSILVSEEIKIICSVQLVKT